LAPLSPAAGNTGLVTLRGSVHPLTRTATDQGAVSGSFAANRLLLLLNRPPEREAALQQFLRDAHTPGSPSYHQWLTPEQFGRQFGPSDAQIRNASGWLTAQGFSGVKASKSRQFIEFSGAAGQVRKAFHTEIHQYSVHGETHYANATEVKIPQAMAALVAGVSQMNDFHAQPQVHVAGPARYGLDTKKTTPLWTIPNPYGTANPYAYTVTPQDFYTQYDLAPLYAAGVNGTGQTIGIVNESNIDLSLVQAYQKLFGIAGTTPQVVIDGDDPGSLDNVDVEAYLDVELSGAVAPKAAINLYIAEGSHVQDPLALAALRAVDDNQAAVLSVSFGSCEYYLGNAGNQFWSGLWEQAAAQGQTVLVSAGDSGSECSLEVVNTVSGLASTPWNVAVGGTDFYYSDYATGGASATSLWNQSNTGNLGSLIAPLPEQPWDDPYGLNVIADGYQRGERAAGGGGASNCATQNDTANPLSPCTGGYPKPTWQAGSGVPTDSVRDLPDVSLFASNGANLSAYAICAAEGQCAAGSGANAVVYLVGGTSASAPAMAGIMALVNQKYGRQGQANYTLYALAQQKPATFHDIAVGSNSEVCGGQSDPPICVLQWNGIYGTPQYPAGPGYDQASGLGSVDANVLVNNWNTLIFQPTTTTLRLSTNSAVHGTPVTISAAVAAESGSGTPTGDVAILTNSTLPSSQSQLFISLANGTGSSTVNYLPGGSYQITGRYSGDGTYAASDSPLESLTVTQEKSNIGFSIQASGSTLPPTGGNVPYGLPPTLVVQPTGASATAGASNGPATGTATFTIDSTSVTVALNASGVAVWTPPALSIGSHTASASYSGDASYSASASSVPIAINVTGGYVAMSGYLIGPYTDQITVNGQTVPGYGYYMNPGGNLTLSVIVQADSNASQFPAPTGTVQICLSTYPGMFGECQVGLVTSQTVPLVPLTGAGPAKSLAVATFANLGPGPDGYYFFNAVYSGDSLWDGGSIIDVSPINIQALPAYAPTTTNLSITPVSISGAQTATITGTVTGAGNPGTSPTGELDFYDNDVLLTYCFWQSQYAVAGATSTCTFEVNPSWFNQNGANQLVAMYWGDGANGPSVSNEVSFTAAQTVGDFSLAPQSPQIVVQPGATATVGLNLQSLSNFNGAVALSCTPSSTQFTCSLNPANPTLNGTNTATLTIDATVQTARLAQPLRRETSRWPLAAGMLCFGFLFAGSRARRKLCRGLFLGCGLCLMMLATSCGGSSSSTTTSTTGTVGASAPGAYSVLVTATANGIIHNAKIAVIVP
jgi:subtilase family serine protease